MFFNRGAAGKKLDYFLSFLQYYIYTKNLLPMDIEFLVQDIFSLTRPQWKLASNLEEATKAFQLAIEQNSKLSGLNKAPEPEEGSSSGSSDDDVLPLDDEDEDDGADDADPEVCLQKVTSPAFRARTNPPCLLQNNEQDLPRDSESEEEAIVVTRQQEEIDPELEAEFEREYAKMMAESLDPRKTERKQAFDVPLPIRPKTRDSTTGKDTVEAGGNQPTATATMAFSLLTKKGNRQQVRILLSWPEHAYLEG